MRDVADWLVLGATIALLLGSAIWTNRRYARFDKLPGHFDIRGRPTCFFPRAVVAWLLPLVFTITAVVLVFVVMVIPQSETREATLYFVAMNCLILLAAQAFVLCLIERWARSQDQS